MIIIFNQTLFLTKHYLQLNISVTKHYLYLKWSLFSTEHYLQMNIMKSAWWWEGDTNGRKSHRPSTKGLERLSSEGWARIIVLHVPHIFVTILHSPHPLFYLCENNQLSLKLQSSDLYRGVHHTVQLYGRDRYNFSLAS